MVAFAQRNQALLTQLFNAISALSAAQTQLAAIQVQINALVASGQALTPAEQMLLTTLQAQQGAVNAAIQTGLAALNTSVGGLIDNTLCTSVYTALEGCPPVKTSEAARGGSPKIA